MLLGELFTLKYRTRTLLRNRLSFTSVIGLIVWVSSGFVKDDPAHVPKDTLFAFGTQSIQHSYYISGVAGFNYFQNLYLQEGIFYFVTTDPDVLPEDGAGYIMSRGYPEDDDGLQRPEPAGKDRWQVITPRQAREKFSGAAVKHQGTTIFFNDTKGPKSPSFIDHYFHFIAELFLGAWRVLASAGEHEMPSTLIYRAGSGDWRDPAALTPWFQQTVMPETRVEDGPDFHDRSQSGVTYLFDKIVIVDRWAAHRYGVEVEVWNKATADLRDLPVPADWMGPLREALKRLVIADGCDLKEGSEIPVVTYINRQLTGRRLNPWDADNLLDELIELNNTGTIELHDAQMENVPRVDQFCLALRTDIMIGVHGNGLTHQLWMPKQSAVIEIMNEGGFAMDYALLASLMNHDYYAIHNDRVFEKSQWRLADGSATQQNEGFHGDNIRVNAQMVGKLVDQVARAKIVPPGLKK